MMRSTVYVEALAIIALVSVSGCDEHVDAPESGVVDNTEVNDQVTYRNLVDNGLELNGARFNGARFNGARFNGARFNGARFNGARFNGTAYSGSVNGVSLSGWALEAGTTKLRATGADSTVYAGNGLVDSELDYEVDDELQNITTQRLKITAISQSSEQPDVFFTSLVFESSPGVWSPFCKDGADNPTEAIAVPGYFDPATASWEDDGSGAVAFACRGTAAGKCIEWGYRMWALQGGTIPLADYYRACTRMVRADYCGNGQTHTVNGNPIDVSDAAGVQVPETGWPVEAKWGPNGAVCINTPRRVSWSRAAVISECVAAGRGTIPTCTDSNPSERGGLVMTQANAL